MEKEQILGYWILEERSETPQQSSSFEIDGKCFSFKSSTIEVLIFTESNNKCY